MWIKKFSKNYIPSGISERKRKTVEHINQKEDIMGGGRQGKAEVEVQEDSQVVEDPEFQWVIGLQRYANIVYQ